MKLPFQGILKGMWFTWGHMVDTYAQDIGARWKHKTPFQIVVQDITRERQTVNEHGIFTVQYPDERLEPRESFRFIPFLLYDSKTDASGSEILNADTGQPEVAEERCTACGICAKVCPPQCIWIVRAVGEDGKPKPKAAEFYIDIDVCMNCGFCAEFCPFDAIKMDNDFELAGYDRHLNHVFDINALMRPASYYAKIKPTFYKEEEDAKRAKEEAKTKKPADAAKSATAAAAKASSAPAGSVTN